MPDGNSSETLPHHLVQCGIISSHLDRADLECDGLSPIFNWALATLCNSE